MDGAADSSTPSSSTRLRSACRPPSCPSTDTAQLLALIVAQQVLDDAVRTQFAELDRSRVSVILGATGGQELLGAMASRLNRPLWLQGMRRAGVPEDVAVAACDQIADLHPSWTESTFPGLLGNVIAGRIANRLDLGGTNCVTDAACASSFSAISMGINELYLGDSDLVISGGVDTMNDILMFMCFSKTPALSRTEDVRPFSEHADGTMLGEGIGMVALKRLEDAERRRQQHLLRDQRCRRELRRAGQERVRPGARRSVAGDRGDVCQGRLRARDGRVGRSTRHGDRRR